MSFKIVNEDQIPTNKEGSKLHNLRITCSIFYNIFNNMRKANILFLYFITVIFINMTNWNILVNTLPNNFHISLTSESNYSVNFQSIKPLNYQFGNVISNLTIFSKTINKEDSAILTINKSNYDISTSYSNLFDINNQEIFISQNDFALDYIYNNSTLFSQKPININKNSTNNHKIIKCNYFINSPNVTYNWINTQTYIDFEKYSFLTFILKANNPGVFYLNYIFNTNQLNEVKLQAQDYNLENENFIKIWVIENKYSKDDFLVLAKPKEKDYELIIFTLKLENLNDDKFNLILNYYSKISMVSDQYKQINKIGFYKNQFIFAMKKMGLVIFGKSNNQIFPLNPQNSTNINMTSNTVNNSNIIYPSSDENNWVIITSIYNFMISNRMNNQKYLINKTIRIQDNVYSNQSNNVIINELHRKRYMQSNASLANITQTNPNLNQNNNTINNSNLNNTNNDLNNNPNGNGNITVFSTNILDMIINEFTIYVIVENKGLFIINLGNFEVLENFVYENPYLYKLEFYNNIYFGNKYLGIHAENYESSFQEIYIELLIDNEFSPLANKVFTSKDYFGQGKSVSYDDLFTLVLDSRQKRLILIRKGMINSIPFLTYIFDLSSYIKFDMEKTQFLSLFDNQNKKVFYSLHTMDLLIAFNINFIDDIINCIFTEPGLFELKFIQKSEICNENLNSNKAKSYCEKNFKFTVEVVGLPSSDVQQLLTGVIITFSIILIIIIIFVVFKTDGCKNVKYFKIIKSAEIRERLYYDAGQDINIEGNTKREILTHKILIENQVQNKINNVDFIKNSNSNIENLNILSTAKNFRYIFDSDNIKKDPKFLEIRKTNQADGIIQENQSHVANNIQVEKLLNSEDINKKHFDFNDTIKEKFNLNMKKEK